MVDMSTGVLFSNTAPRTSRHFFSLPLGCIWKTGGDDQEQCDKEDHDKCSKVDCERWGEGPGNS